MYDKEENKKEKTRASYALEITKINNHLNKILKADSMFCSPLRKLKKEREKRRSRDSRRLTSLIKNTTMTTI